MTTELEALKTKEFLRRRKLRIQQVREQSKDIAKKIRQRVKVETLRQFENLDTEKAKEYLDHQDKLVRRLEELYARGIKNVGTGHKNAEQVKLQDISLEKVDLSKSRGKVAAAELRRKKQEKLDTQKKILDRKLQAREAANEISRDKSSAVASRLLAKSSSSKCTSEHVKDVDVQTDTVDLPVISNPDEEKKENDRDIATGETELDMQGASLTKVWEPNIPTLPLPQDIGRDTQSPEPSAVTISSEKRPRLNLFAVSNEMPSSLCGGSARSHEETVKHKPSVTLVSEYILARDLRLRETTSLQCKQSSDNLQNIKQTIMKSRSSKPEGTDANRNCMRGSNSRNFCRVVDEQMIPVPPWQAGRKGPCDLLNRQSSCTKSKNVPIPRINKPTSFRSRTPNALLPRSIVRSPSPFRRRNVPPLNLISGNKSRQSSPDKRDDSSAFTRRHLVKTYDHVTKDIQDKPYADKKLVTRDTTSQEDAYSLAMRESSHSAIDKERQRESKMPDTRYKVAMSKNTVDKEYKDTMAFLKNMPKGSRPVKTAFKDEKRQEAQNERKQRRLQYEFKKIQKDCMNKTPLKEKRCSKLASGDDSTAKVQYSWMPAPEGDDSLAVHTIPTNVRSGKAGMVTFASAASYHEYRSRHKHTPPTKDTVIQPHDANASPVKDSDSTECFSVASDSSSVDGLSIVCQPEKGNAKTEYSSSDMERILINKILESKLDEKSKLKNLKLFQKIAKNLSSSNKDTTATEKTSRSAHEKPRNGDVPAKADKTGPRVSIDQTAEGICIVNEEGEHMKAMCSSDGQAHDGAGLDSKPMCSCQIADQKKCPEKQSAEKLHKTCAHSSANSPQSSEPTKNVKQPDKDRGRLKLVDNAGNEAGEFYIGATGFLKDDDYEVIIQLRKVDALRNQMKENIEAKEIITKTPVADNEGLQKQMPEIPDPQTKRQSADVLCSTGNTQSSTDNAKSSTGNTCSNTGSQEIVSSLESDEPKTHEEGLNVNDSNNNKNDETTTPYKGICTTFFNKFALSVDAKVGPESHKDNVDKGVCTTLDYEFVRPIDPAPRATAGTQTSLESPPPIPLSLQMSSSTSTAYLSPPDPIIPHYLKCETMQYLFINKDKDYDDSQHYGGRRGMECDKTRCTCRPQCPHPTNPKVLLNHLQKLSARDANSTKSSHPARSGHSQLKENPMNSSQFKATSPTRSATSKTRSTTSNSGAHSTLSSPNRQSYRSPYSQSNNAYLKNMKSNLTNNVCDSALKTCNKSRSCSKKVTIVSKGPCPDAVCRNTNITKKVNNKTNLKPAVKGYVDKLLTLNRATKKAIKVVDQECSAVTTPGSSIIEIPRNCNDYDPTTAIDLIPKISLEQIKDTLIECLLDNIKSNGNIDMPANVKSSVHLNRKKSVHKVKSLNVSKQLRHKRSDNTQGAKSTEPSSTSSTKDDVPKITRKIRSKSSPSPRDRLSADLKCKSKSSEIVCNLKMDGKKAENISLRNPMNSDVKTSQATDKSKIHQYNRKKTGLKLPNDSSLYGSKSLQSISTQTGHVSNELNFMRIAEGKLQNIEKIADLTEKCTMRLSNLAKVLDEVRKSKSAHKISRVSDSEPDICRIDDLPRLKLSPSFDKVNVEHHKSVGNQHVDRCTGDHVENVDRGIGDNIVHLDRRSSDINYADQSIGDNIELIDRGIGDNIVHLDRRAGDINHADQSIGDNIELIDRGIGDNIVHLDRRAGDMNHADQSIGDNIELIDRGIGDNIVHLDRRAGDIKHADQSIGDNIERIDRGIGDYIVHVDRSTDDEPKKEETGVMPYKQVETLLDVKPANVSVLEYTSFFENIPKPNKSRSPVLSTEVSHSGLTGAPAEVSHLKCRGKPPPALSRKILKHTKDVVPHELSTVIEVDSPLSLKLRNHNDGQVVGSHATTVEKEHESPTQEFSNPDLLQTNVHKDHDDSDPVNKSAKNKMMDLKQFNDIMLKPFMTIEEYAKQYNIEALDEGSHPGAGDLRNDDLSPYHSESSLPDVIAELLKRNLINEPFKFDSVSNVNSTTASSDSTISSLSLLAQSKVRNERKSKKMFVVPESSDTMSISSNPDLENAFKQLGMGWASSTLKKTKERLALSSTSNTSSSSLSHFKAKSGKSAETPAMVASDTVSSSAVSLTERKEAEQQTSDSISMTVKQFLAKELADKITFTHSPREQETENEFMSLFETKVPENMKHSEVVERSAESARSGNNARARTSTPVRLFKSSTYHSSSVSGSGSNNGLFSNADDLSSVKGTNNSTSDKDDLTIPNYSLQMKKSSDCS